MKTNFILLADSLEGLRNGSFLKLYLNGDVARFINGDYMGTSDFDPSRDQRISDKRVFPLKEAKKHLPACFGYERSK